MEKGLSWVDLNTRGKAAETAWKKPFSPGPPAAVGPHGEKWKTKNGSGPKGKKGPELGNGLGTKASGEEGLFRKSPPERRKSSRYVSMVPVTLANARPKRGFTMVEILVTIGILTLSLAIATPYVQKQAINTNLKSAVRAIESDIFDLKQRAISENIPFAMVFDTSANNYTVQQNGAPVEVKTPAVFGSDIQITSAPFSGGSTLSFQTGGTATSGSIVLTNGRRSTATLSINIAGRTYVQYNML